MRFIRTLIQLEDIRKPVTISRNLSHPKLLKEVAVRLVTNDHHHTSNHLSPKTCDWCQPPENLQLLPSAGKHTNAAKRGKTRDTFVLHLIGWINGLSVEPITGRCGNHKTKVTHILRNTNDSLSPHKQGDFNDGKKLFKANKSPENDLLFFYKIKITIGFTCFYFGRLKNWPRMFPAKLSTEKYPMFLTVSGRLLLLMFCCFISLRWAHSESISWLA